MLSETSLALAKRFTRIARGEGISSSFAWMSRRATT